ncbi:Protein of unknown function [Tenacibaculum sp. MAR_2009_124]|uniref:conjugative transposon protein TraM n=1 Tax=Tenacibaculum sp. MAR_2009_124 TaxID=1250059 RepID=UPI0008967916|nr:conjugative transposon protein TraM [Tenacibaculum sp. MAR_2009_124]SEC65557.1 Protein of unknown function [Tenacibaculum sp. MAR_2009_124]
MKFNKEKFENWIKKNLLFAVLLPIILFGGGYYVYASIKKVGVNQGVSIEKGYNNKLPFKKKEVEVKNPQDYYKKEVKDSIINSSVKKHQIKSFTKKDREKDSFTKVLNSLENFSFKEKPKKENTRKTYNKNKSVNSSKPYSNKSESESIDQWRQRIEKENEDFYNSPSAKYNESNSVQKTLKSDNEIYAVVYKDQEILNNGRVWLRLSQDALINGVIFKRNTLFYGFTKFAKNRIYININSINDVKVNLSAYDAQDSNIGLYTEVEFFSIASNEIHDDAIDEVNTSKIPLGNTLKRIIKKKKRVDKVPLLNESKLTLKTN